VLRVSFKVEFYAKCAVLRKTAQFQAKTFCTSETEILKYNLNRMSFKLKITQLKIIVSLCVTRASFMLHVIVDDVF